MPPGRVGAQPRGECQGQILPAMRTFLWSPAGLGPCSGQAPRTSGRCLWSEWVPVPWGSWPRNEASGAGVAEVGPGTPWFFGTWSLVVRIPVRCTRPQGRFPCSQEDEMHPGFQQAPRSGRVGLCDSRLSPSHPCCPTARPISAGPGGGALGVGALVISAPLLAVPRAPPGCTLAPTSPLPPSPSGPATRCGLWQGTAPPSTGAPCTPRSRLVSAAPQEPLQCSPSVQADVC